MPSVVLVSVPGEYPQYVALTAHLYRIEFLSPGVPVQLLLDALGYFGTVWNIVLTALMFKVVGDLNWKRTIIGSAAATAVSWLLASIFRLAGML